MATRAIDQTVEAAREAHRDHLGRFGAQPATESECSLGPSRDAARMAAMTLLHDFDPALPGTSGRSTSELLALHSELTRGAFPAASMGERARAVTASVRACRDGSGGLVDGSADVLAAGFVDGHRDLSDPLVRTHRAAFQHLCDVASGAARIGDHPDDEAVLRDYRNSLRIRVPAPEDSTSALTELEAAWSWRLDIDALTIVRESVSRRSGATPWPA